ncbi:15-hydroxyprostaglandin dehydrogenase (NAD) [Entomortierella parvispora]|uniref:15-hydroxyprostaglandin dehydrogenase (NAD) n=1 Tax=Entomortierella parvispora TaxID=205924 RepID=A0A9P3LU60_9FUNG|nr:15-hydroxyprostaglandin dehydrogenase (NAD) [Entomortierella parvispora]
MHVENKVVIITGGASGIGKALVERLVKHGAKVVIADMNAQAGEELTMELNEGKEHKVAHFVQCDVTKSLQLVSLFTAAEEHFGGLDILVNNAGLWEVSGPFFGIPGSVVDADTIAAAHEENTLRRVFPWKRLIEVDLVAVLEGTRIALDVFRKQGRGGLIINTASLQGVNADPMVMTPAYVAAKFGVVGFTRNFKGLEQGLLYEGKYKGVRVNAIAPGTTDTAMLNPVRQIIKDTRLQMQTAEPVVDAFMMIIEDDSISGEIFKVTPEEGCVLVPAVDGAGLTGDARKAQGLSRED